MSSLLWFSLFCGYLAAQDGSIDGTFTGTGADTLVRKLLQQPDGRIIVAGDFAQMNGVPINHIARLNTNGSLDASFNPGSGTNAWVGSLALQPDGKILIAGWFTQVSGVTRSRVARLNADGSLDPTFDPGTGTDDAIFAMALQPDGKVVIVGNFTQVNGVARGKVARLKADGSLDTGFDPGAGVDIWVAGLAIQPDGKIMIGGFFTSVNGVARNHIARLNPDGSLDLSFDPASGTDSPVISIAVQSDGQVLIGGDFIQVNNVGRNYIARLNVDGSLDTSFDPGSGADGVVISLAAQPDGKVLIGGGFTEVNGVSRNGVARLSADGGLDVNFDPGTGANDLVNTVTLQADGKILIGGWFTEVNGVVRNRLARLNNGIAPVFTSAPVLQAEPGKTYAYTVTATGAPNPTFSVTSLLPAWLDFNAATGVLTGTPDSNEAGTSVAIAIVASNGVQPDATQSFTINVRRRSSEKSESSGCTALARTARMPTLLLAAVVLIRLLLPRCSIRRGGVLQRTQGEL